MVSRLKGKTALVSGAGRNNGKAMRQPHYLAGMLSAVLIVSGASVVCGQDYPNKPIRIVAPEIGGSGDFAARLVAQGLTGSLGQQVIIENRGGSYIPQLIVSKAAPDGYTLHVNATGFWIGPLLQKAPYDPIRDFAPISVMTSSSNVLVVHPSLAAKSVKELIVLAKARPGELNYATGLSGSSSHLAGELFKHMAGVNFVRVPYKGNGPAVIGLIGGEAQLMFPSATAVTPHLKSGKLRALAVTSAEPSALAPGLPTVAAAGLPGYESVGRTVILAPAKTPAPIIQRLNQEVVRVLKQPDVKEKFFNTGVETVGSTPEQLTAMAKSEMARIGKMIKDVGIKADE